MIFNKIIKSTAMALPLLALAACSSNYDKEEEKVKIYDDNVAKEEVVITGMLKESIMEVAKKRAAEVEEQNKIRSEMLLSQRTISFDFDSSNINGEFLDMLDAHAKFLRANTNVSVLIEGHSDKRGTYYYNRELGERRAKAISNYLESMGVSDNQLSIISHGEEKPINSGNSRSDFAENRRALIVY